jgi:hypothetical protein
VVGHGGGGDVRVRIVDRRVKIGFHNGHALMLPDGGGGGRGGGGGGGSARWAEASLLESDDDDDVLLLPPDMHRCVIPLHI